MEPKKIIDKSIKVCDEKSKDSGQRDNRKKDSRTVDYNYDTWKRKVLSVRVDPARDRIYVKFLDNYDPVPYENEHTDIKKACQLLLRDTTITGFNNEAKSVIQKYAQ